VTLLRLDGKADRRWRTRATELLLSGCPILKPARRDFWQGGGWGQSEPNTIRAEVRRARGDRPVPGLQSFPRGAGTYNFDFCGA